MDIAGFGQVSATRTVSNSLTDLLGAGATKKADENDPAAAAAAKAEARKAQQRAQLEEIREKGIYAWAQEQKKEKLEEMARQRVLAQRGLDDKALAAMPEEARSKIETSIQEEVAQLVKDALQKDMEGKAHQAAQDGQPTGPMIIDISV
jgi:hypothetical protein